MAGLQQIEENIMTQEEQIIIENICKFKYFIERTDNSKPSLPASIDIVQLVRQYLNDDDFAIYTAQKYIFSDNEQQQLIDEVYQKWLQHQQGEQDIDDFLQFWIRQSPQLTIYYSLYDDNKNNINEKQYQINKDHITQERQIRKDKQGGKSDNKGLNGQEKDGTKADMSNVDTFLSRFFTLFAKKQVNSINNATFNSYELYYNTISLNKWMHYIKEIGLLKYSKIINSNKFKEIFMKYQNKEQVLIYSSFKEAIMKVLAILFNEDQEKIIKQGYQLLGIKDKLSFQNKFKEMGYLPPVIMLNKQRKDTKRKVMNKGTVIKTMSLASQGQSLDSSARNELKKLQSISILLPKIAPRTQENTNDNHNNKNAHNSSIISDKTQIYDIRQSNISNLSLLQRNSYKNGGKDCQGKKRIRANALIIQQLMMQEEDDPYLKRYNNKENKFKFSCIANRIDQRIQKINNKN